MRGANWFGRFLLPGLAFKAVVIGGGYATGRELATFFLPGGPWGGIFAMTMVAAIWSIVCALTFLIAWRTRSGDYRGFFRHLLSRFWPVFEIAYGLALMVTLAVFGASAGAIGAAVLGLPPIVGTLALVVAIAGFSTFGNASVEPLFKYVSIFLYMVYAIFLFLALERFSDRIAEAFTRPEPVGHWVSGGLAYAVYNVAGAVVILPALRHLRSGRDAVVAGLLAGPLALVPAILFLIAMAAFHPAIVGQLLPSEFLLNRLDSPVFHIVFQAMIFAALVESGVGGTHAINERIAGSLRARGRELSSVQRIAISALVLGFSVFVASRVGLIDLVAQGYRLLAYAFLAVFVIPLLTRGLWLAIRRAPSPATIDTIRAS